MRELWIHKITIFITIGSPENSCHFDVIDVAIYKIYYMEKNGDSSQVWTMMSHKNVFCLLKIYDEKSCDSTQIQTMVSFVWTWLISKVETCLKVLG